MSECKSCKPSAKGEKKSAQLPLGAGHSQKEKLKREATAIGQREAQKAKGKKK